MASPSVSATLPISQLSPPGASLDRLVFDDLARSFAPPVLPTADDLTAVRTAFAPPRDLTQVEGWDLSGLGHRTAEGRTFRLDVSLGTVQLRVFDANRRELALSRAQRRQRGAVDLRSGLTVAVDELTATPQLPGLDDDQAAELAGLEHALLALDRPAGLREVVQWSAKSRARMVKTLAGLDISPMLNVPGDLAMVTLTYWGKGWQCAAPDGATTKKHLAALAERWRRTFGSWITIWKFEFQHRGAPHFHILVSVPALVAVPVDGCVHAGPLKPRQARKSLCRCGSVTTQEWLSAAWADIVAKSAATRDCTHDHDHAVEYAKHLAAGTAIDFSAPSNYSDHKRVAVYFLKHATKASGSKEYQHVVPESWRAPGAGPGRFWGYTGLELPIESVDLDLDDGLAARRVLRRAAQARRRHIAYQRARAAGGSVRAALQASAPPVRSLGAGGSLTGGWVLTNDGTAFALDLARWLKQHRTTPRPARKTRARRLVPAESGLTLPPRLGPHPDLNRSADTDQLDTTGDLS